MKKILLRKEKGFALVDDEDYGRVSAFTWSLGKRNGTDYAVRDIKKNGRHNVMLLHRFIMGVTDRHVLVDHVDHNGLNNQKSNLRLVTFSQNLRNARKARKPRSSKYKGVCYSPEHYIYFPACWRAAIYVSARNKNLGKFATEEEAAKAYDSAAREHFGSFACCNFPETSEPEKPEN